MWLLLAVGWLSTLALVWSLCRSSAKLPPIEEASRREFDGQPNGPLDAD